MRQVFRLMDMPDKVIAFDELPADMLQGLEMCDCSKMPKAWKDYIGYREKVTLIPPDRDPLTGTVRTYTPIVQKGPYAYLIDREINHDKERWSEIESYVRRNAPRDFRLMDRISDMALPMARDAHSELTLEPEDVKVIPLSSSVVEEPQQATVAVAPVLQAVADPAPAVVSEPTQPFTITPAKAAVVPMTECPACQKVFSSRQALRMHVMKKHSEEKVAA